VISSRALIFALVVASSVARAQDPRLTPLFSSDARASLATVIDAARADRLPVEPLVQRAIEGARRGIEVPRVLAAVKSLAERLRVARTALGANSTDAELVAGASLLSLDVGPAVLSELRSRTTERDVSLPLIVLTDIIERGVPRDTATAVIMSLGAARVADADYHLLRQSILLDIGSGTSPAAAAAVRARAILVNRGVVPRRPPS
jgi:hypothetical protein